MKEAFVGLGKPKTLIGQSIPAPSGVAEVAGGWGGNNGMLIVLRVVLFERYDAVCTFMSILVYGR